MTKVVADVKGNELRRPYSCFRRDQNVTGLSNVEVDMTTGVDVTCRGVALMVRIFGCNDIGVPFDNLIFADAAHKAMIAKRKTNIQPKVEGARAIVKIHDRKS